MGTFRRREHQNCFSLRVHRYLEVSQDIGMRRREWEALLLIALSRTFSFLSSKAFEKQRGQLKRKVALMERERCGGRSS